MERIFQGDYEISYNNKDIVINTWSKLLSDEDILEISDTDESIFVDYTLK